MLVSVADLCNLVQGEGFLPPKSNPITVKSEDDVDGNNFNALGVDFGGINAETFAESYNMKPVKVCKRRPTLISITEGPGNEGGVRHFRKESDIHM